MSSLNDLLEKSIESGASDLHIVPHHYPQLRVNTELVPMEFFGTASPEQTVQMAMEMLGQKRFEQLEANRDLDFSYRLPDATRFRVNAHYQRDTISIAFRRITPDIPPLEALHLPPAIGAFAKLPRGLVLVTGPTGSGKSTTLASIINRINETDSRHIITLEDPVEYEIHSNQCLIEQREVGMDVTSFASGLKHALRQDPDVILVGEMRDLETTSAALTAAETGHLVLSTLHTQSAAQTLERIIDIYPGEQQAQVRSMLSNTLQAVVTQTLFKRVDKVGMAPACEVMICNNGIRNCIRENRIHEIPGMIETGRQEGMCLLDDSIRSLFFNGMISKEHAISRANRQANMMKQLNA